MNPEDKINIAIYWGAGCGGCDVAMLDIDEKILDIHAIANIVFWPIGFDHKLSNLEAMPDKSITIGFYNGAIRNSENEHVARVMREKSAIIIALGTCATSGGTPGLANVTNREEIFKTVYDDLPSNDNPDHIHPTTKTMMPEGELELPEFYDRVYPLDEIIDVDYFMPGCPPTKALMAQAITLVVKHVTEGAALPPKGTVIASDKCLCDECDRERVLDTDRNVEKIYMPYEIMADETKCLLDQGIICLGPATRAGCGAQCPTANMPCRGCMGPTSAVMDQGTSMLSAVSSILDMGGDDALLSEDDIDDLMDQIKDPIGTFYAFTLPKSLINHVVRERRS